MKTNLKFWTVVMGLITVNLGCGVADTFQTQLISKKGWQLIASKTTSPSGTVNNFTNLKACERDNLHHFKVDGNLEIDEGPSKCNPNDPQTYIEARWSFSDDENYLAINDREYFVIELSDDQLILRSDFEIQNQSITIELSYRR